jgi:hypothetical protein
MLGKAVKIRHCPATVNGKLVRKAGTKSLRKREDEFQQGRRESGDRFLDTD